MLSEWPLGSLKTLAISQDPPLRAAEPTPQFAQPLVFFSLEPFSALSVSLLSPKVTGLQIKLPSRNILPVITKFEDSFPNIALLDMSTCLMKQPDVEKLLMKLTDVQHLILDGCNLIRGVSPDDEEWFALGKMCALIGTKRARDREKKLKRDLEEMDVKKAEKEMLRTQEAGPSSIPANSHRIALAGYLTPQAVDLRKGKKGRKGIANATISIRKPSPPPRPSRGNAPASARPGLTGRANQPNIPRIRVMPPPPALLTLSTTNHTTSNPEHHKQIQEEFGRGWESGLEVLKSTWLRLRTSQSHGGVRLMCLEPRKSTLAAQFVSETHREGKPNPDVDSESSDSDSSESTGRSSVHLDYLTRGLLDYVAGKATDFVTACPILCLGGSDPNANHPPGCGHSFCPASWKQSDVSIA